MAEEKSLVTVEQKAVEFYGDELIAIRADDGHVYVSVRHLCAALGLARQGQVRRIRDNTILAEGYRGGNILLPPGPGGGRQQAGMLRADLVPLWLSGVRVKAVKEEIRPKLERYQREAAKVLWEAFQEGRLTTDPVLDELLARDTDAVEAYKMIAAMLKLARNQVMLEARLDAQEGRLERHELRLETIESQLGDPDAAITPDQASQISQAVKAVAIALSKQTKRNEFGAIYGEMYRKFGITSYKLLPAHRFKEAVGWLNNWLQSLIGDEPF